MNKINQKMQKNTQNNNNVYKGERQDKKSKTKRGNDRWNNQD